MHCPKTRIVGFWARYHLQRRSGVAQLAERSAVNRIVVGSIPTPGANEAGCTQVRSALHYGTVQRALGLERRTGRKLSKPSAPVAIIVWGA